MGHPKGYKTYFCIGSHGSVSRSHALLPLWILSTVVQFCLAFVHFHTRISCSIWMMTVWICSAVGGSLLRSSIENYTQFLISSFSVRKVSPPARHSKTTALRFKSAKPGISIHYSLMDSSSTVWPPSQREAQKAKAVWKRVMLIFPILIEKRRHLSLSSRCFYFTFSSS